MFSNALPGKMHDLAAAMLRGDLEKARKLDLEYLDLMDGFFMDVNPIPIKEAMFQMGLLRTNFCRMPLTTMTAENTASSAPCCKSTPWCNSPLVKRKEVPVW